MQQWLTPDLAQYMPLLGLGADVAPAMPASRKLTIATAPLLRPGKIGEAYFARAYRRLEAGRHQHAIRVEFAERFFARELMVDIDPKRLEHQLIDVVSTGSAALRLSHWFLDKGDWSRALFPLKASLKVAEIDAVFDYEGRLDEAPIFRDLLDRAAQGRPEERNGVPLTNPAAIQAYLEHYVALRRSIEEHGFWRRSEITAETTSRFSGTAVRRTKDERNEREVGIAIGADGTVARIVGGNHRTAIAQRLGLSRIPAQVRLVHAEWLRGWIARTCLSPARALAHGLQHLCLLLMMQSSIWVEVI
ncbi:hypothetical protein [Methylobacterium durans]|uniref:ParB/Sulfiredoxin domain-containing protein n=1 Tax=Methylobacterium durans TaxID=2202825 RepID=A0A2U8W630_9HYPH|nr:hypothetical protein [Methylobacterium durans]AWN40746.1 hypothetical protein DK389_09690 [Methylobacterium durans]